MFVSLKSSVEAGMEGNVEVGPLVGGIPDDEMIVLRRRLREP